MNPIKKITLIFAATLSIAIGTVAIAGDGGAWDFEGNLQTQRLIDRALRDSSRNALDNDERCNTGELAKTIAEQLAVVPSLKFDELGAVGENEMSAAQRACLKAATELLRSSLKNIDDRFSGSKN